MASSADSLVRDGIRAYQAGNKDEARQLFMQAVDMDEQSEQGWLWLSAVVDSVHDQQTCLENVLTINPNNEKARQGLRILSEKTDTAPTVSAPASPEPEDDDDDDELPDEDVFADISFMPEETPAAAPPPLPAAPTSEVQNDADELPENINWGSVETSSASARRPGNEPTPDDYNDWISGLNIGNNDAELAFGPADEAPAFSASPFIGDDLDMDEDTPFRLDESVFNFSKQAPSPAPAQDVSEPLSADVFDIDEDENDARPEPVAAAPPAPPSTPPPAPVTGGSGPNLNALLDEIVEDDLDDDLDDFGESDLGAIDPEEFFKFIPNEITVTRMPGTNERYPPLLVIALFLLLLFNVGAVVFTYLTLSGGLG
jgi:hypothetical protein